MYPFVSKALTFWQGSDIVRTEQKAIILKDSKTADLSPFQTAAAVSSCLLVNHLYLSSLLTALKKSRMVAKGFKPTSLKSNLTAFHFIQ